MITLEGVRPPRQKAEDGELFQLEKNEYTSAKQELEIRDLESDIEHRKSFSQKIFRFLVAGLAAIFLLIVLNGLSFVEISDAVLMSLIGGMTVNVIGLFAIVANYFFPKR